MNEMFRDVIQQVMEVELDEELGRERCQRSEVEEAKPRNYRNGYSQKKVKTQLGEIDIKVPRDRNGSFEPKIIGKYSRNADGMEDKILALYACGMSQRDIAEQIKSLYEVEISPELVSKISIWCLTSWSSCSPIAALDDPLDIVFRGPVPRSWPATISWPWRRFDPNTRHMIVFAVLSHDSLWAIRATK